MKQIAIVDYGTGNVHSIGRMVSGLGAEWTHTKDPGKLREATHLVLPGVGHCARAMASLQHSGILDVLDERVCQAGVPTLGICLGMQLMTRSSEEGSTECLGWFDMETTEIKPSDRRAYKVPNIGWHVLESANDTLFHDITTSDQPMFFCHRFAVRAPQEAGVIATFNYGADYVAALRHKNLIGVQFHPEKSQGPGRKLMANFLALGQDDV